MVIDDGSAQDVGHVTSGFRDRFALRVESGKHAGVSVARNLAISRSRAPLLLLYDDDLRPLPGLIESCLRFHDERPAIHEVELLRFKPDPEIAETAVVRWAFDRLYPFPRSAGVFGWQHFWGGAVTCKRSLFAARAFDPEYLAVEDAEFALRAGAVHPIAIDYSGNVSGHFHRRLNMMQLCRRQYRMAYFRYLMTQRHHVHFVDPIYEHPEDFVIDDWAAFRTLLAAMASTGGPGPRPLSGQIPALVRRVAKGGASRDGERLARGAIRPGSE